MAAVAIMGLLVCPQGPTAVAATTSEPMTSDVAQTTSSTQDAVSPETPTTPDAPETATTPSTTTAPTTQETPSSQTTSPVTSDTPDTTDTASTAEPSELEAQGTSVTPALSAGTYVIRSACATTQVIDVPGGSRSSSVPLQIFSSNMTLAQRFKVSYDGKGYATITNVNSGLVLDARGGSSANGTVVQQYRANGSSAQKWVVTKNQDGTYTLANAVSKNVVLDIAGGNASDGARVQLWRSNGSNAQRLSFIAVPATVTGGAKISNGTYVLHPSSAASLALDIPGASTASGVRPQVWSANDTLAQAFKITSNSDGTYTIRSMASGKVLDADSGNVVPSTKVQQWNFVANDSNQHWYARENSDGSITFLAATSGLALDVSGNRMSNGTITQLWTDNGTSAQRWSLTEAKASLPTGIQSMRPLCASRYVDLAGGSTANGTNIQIFEGNATIAQKFDVEAVAGQSGVYTIQSLLSGGYLTDKGGNVVSQTGGTSDAQRWRAQIEVGGYSLVNVSTGKALDVVGGRDANGVNVRTYQQNHTKAQTFAFNSTPVLPSGRTFVVASKVGRVLDVAGGSRANGANIQLWDANGTDAQKFVITEVGNGTYSIQSGHSRKYVDVHNGLSANGTNVQQWEGDGWSAQRFRIIPTGDGWFYIQNVNGAYLDVAGGRNANGTNVDVWKGNKTDAQKFRLLETSPAKSEVICIDPGHGSQVSLARTPIGPGSSQMQYVEPGGCEGANTGTPEYVVTLQVALKLRARLEAEGYTVVMTRTTNDVVLSSQTRAEIANNAGADLCIRLHCDSSTSSYVSGLSTLTPGWNQWTGGIVGSSRNAANTIHSTLIGELGCNNRGISERTDLAGFNYSHVPTILVEMGFLSNPSDESLLISGWYQDRIAQALADGADGYFGH